MNCNFRIINKITQWEKRNTSLDHDFTNCPLIVNFDCYLKVKIVFNLEVLYKQVLIWYPVAAFCLKSQKFRLGCGFLTKRSNSVFLTLGRLGHYFLDSNKIIALEKCWVHMATLIFNNLFIYPLFCFPKNVI